MSPCALTAYVGSEDDAALNTEGFTEAFFNDDTGLEGKGSQDGHAEAPNQLAEAEGLFSFWQGDGYTALNLLKVKADLEKFMNVVNEKHSSIASWISQLEGSCSTRVEEPLVYKRYVACIPHACRWGMALQLRFKTQTATLMRSFEESSEGAGNGW